MAVQPSPTGEDLRSVMQHVPAPVTVVTAAGAGEARGATIGSFTSVSLDPPLVSFNVDKESQMHGVLEEAARFAVHLLGEGQSELCTHFAAPGQSGSEQLAAVACRSDGHGTPVLEAAPTVLYCRWHEAFGAGDHTIVVGRVTRLEQRAQAPPILYYEQEYRGVTAPERSSP